ncbi:MAG: hypothetical protein WCQ49_02700 [Candidatus Saccharibacteria bacterium]
MEPEEVNNPKREELKDEAITGAKPKLEFELQSIAIEPKPKKK